MPSMTYDQLTSTPLHMFPVHKASDEEAFRTPLGSLSIRNLVVLGLFLGISWTVWDNAMPDNVSFDGGLASLQTQPPQVWLAIVGIAAPAVIGLILATVKTAFGTADAVLINMIMVLASPPPKRKAGRARAEKASSSMVFGQAAAWRASEAGGTAAQAAAGSDAGRVVTVKYAAGGDRRPRTIQVYGSGNRLARHVVVKVYQSDKLVEYGRRTSAAGEIDVMFVAPDAPGIQDVTVRDYYANTDLMVFRMRWVQQQPSN